MRVLTVAAHPDDETLGAGGTMARLAAHGHEVWICILTDGVTARHAHVEQQKECAIGAADVLGAANVVFCELPDQRLDSLPLLDVITPIEKCIGELRPELVLTHFKEDVNQDHRTVFEATMVAARPVEGTSVRQLLCYETASSTEWAPPFPGSVFSPNVFVDISSTLPRKLEAMRSYERTWTGEMRPYPHPRSYEAIEAYARRHGVAAGVAAAEPFMLVRQVHHEGARPVITGSDIAPGKRLFDLAVSLTALTLLVPLLAVIALLVKLGSPGPVLYRQQRVSRGGRLFELLKFRTMVVGADRMAPNVSATGDPRVTRVGAFLRKTYLDELPQLLNVLRGDMSLVGPRPETPEFVALYSPEERRVLTVRPGLAGPSTLAFMDEADLLAAAPDPVAFYTTTVLHDRVRADLTYLERRSVGYDIRLLAAQVLSIVRRLR